jgi:hypothetical protein
MSAPTKFGHWVEGIGPYERKAQFRSLAALAAAFNGSAHPLVGALRDAERNPAAADQALAILNELPALRRRKMLSVFGVATWPAWWAADRDTTAPLRDKRSARPKK